MKTLRIKKETLVNFIKDKLEQDGYHALIEDDATETRYENAKDQIDWDAAEAIEKAVLAAVNNMIK